MHVNVTFHFDGYVSHPYWIQREKVITITKESGINRARTAVNREKALSAHLAKLEMTMEQYAELVRLADRPFHVNAPGFIVIPRHNIYGCLAQASDLATSSVRLASVEQIRTVLHTSDWVTTKRPEDSETWSRFVVVKSGSGQTLSNQRSLRENAVIKDFEAHGTLAFSPDIVRSEKVHQFLTFAGREVGIGASRKLDWGRFIVTKWEEDV